MLDGECRFRNIGFIAEPILIFWVLLTSIVCREDNFPNLKNKGLYYTPLIIGSVNTLTVDYRDSYNFPLWSLYESPATSAVKSADWVKNFREERDIQIELVEENTSTDLPEDDFIVELVYKKIFLADSHQFKTTPVILLNNFKLRSPGQKNSFRNYCLHVWINITSDDRVRPEIDSDWCLSVRIKIVNSSSVYKNLTDALGGEVITLETNPSLTGLSLPQYWRSMLPRSVNHSMSCKIKDGIVGQNVKPPIFINGSGGHFTYYTDDTDIQKDSEIQILNGYLLEYSPSLSYIKVRSLYLPNFRVLRGAQVTQKCKRVTFGQLEQNGFVFLCEGENKLQLHSFEVFEGKYHIRSKPLDEPVIVWDTTIVPGIYDRCDISKRDRGFLSCRKGVQTNGTLDFSLEIVLFEIVLEPIQARQLSTLNIPQFKVIYEDYRADIDLNPLVLSFEAVKILHKEFTQVVIVELFVRNGTTSAWTWFVSIDLYGDDMQTSFVVSSRDILEDVTKSESRTRICDFEQSALLYAESQQKIYSTDNTNHDYYFDTHDLAGSKLLLYHCFKSARVSGILLDKKLSRKAGNEFRVLLYSLNQTNNAFLRKIADVTIPEYVQGPYSAYYNEDASMISFIFFSITKGVQTRVDWLNISLIDSPGEIRTFSSGTYTCNLSLKSLCMLGANFSTEIMIHVRDLAKGSTKLQKISADIVRKHDHEYTQIDIDNTINFDGPFFEAQFLTSSKRLKNSSKIVVKPRINLDYTFKSIDGASTYEELVWIHEDWLFAYKKDRVEMLQRFPDYFGDEIVENSFIYLPSDKNIVLRNYIKYDQGYRLGASAFKREFYQQEEFFVVALYFSDQRPMNVSNPAVQTSFILTLLKISTKGLGEDGYPVNLINTFLVPSYTRERKGSLQVLLLPDLQDNSTEGEEAKYLWVHAAIGYNSQLAVLRSLTVSMNKTTGAWWARQLAGYSFIEAKTLACSEGGFYIKQMQLLYFNTTMAMSKHRHIFLAVLTEDFFHILTYGISAKRDWLHTPKSSFKYHTDTFQGNILAFNCSLEWARCVFSLDGGDLITITIAYSTEKERWYSFSQDDEVKREVIPTNHAVSKLIFGKRHMLAYDPYMESYMFVYKRSVGFRHPYVGLKKQFREEHTVRLLQHPGDSGKELLFKTEGLSSGGVYSFPPLTLKIYNLTESDEREFAKSRILINDLQQGDGIPMKSFTLPLKIKVTELKLPGEGLSLKIVVLIGVGLFVLILVARLIIYVWYKLRKNEDESILATDYVDPFEFDYTFEM